MEVRSESTEVPCTEVLCTRPKSQGENPHINEIPNEDIIDINKRREQKCKTCGMPLIVNDRYVPLQEIGQGGFGKTFLVLDLDTPWRSLQHKRKRVIKQLCPRRPLSPPQLEIAEKLFEKEAKVLEELKHRRIPQLYAYFELQIPPDSRSVDSLPSNQQKLFYLVQEYIEGEDLGQELNRRGQFSEAEVLEVLSKLLRILNFIHTSNPPLIHRDIKPQNIMRHEQDGKFYLVDFGAVKEVIKVVDSNTRIISYGFSAPEQIDSGEVSFSSDLYSLAATCINLLTAQNPERLRIPDQLAEWRQHTQVSNKLAHILNRMLHPDPNRRFQSAEKVLKKLRKERLIRQDEVNTDGITIRGKTISWATVGLVVGAILAVVVIVPFTPLGQSLIRLIEILVNPLPPEYFSRGEEILLDKKNNSSNQDCQAAFDNKNKGTEAFVKRDYQKAVDFFEKAVNKFEARCPGGDPETLIYLNNAKANLKALQTGKTPLTIAVIVPVGDPTKNAIAKSTLSGPAHVQNIVNGNGGIKGHLLQIIIAIDTDKIANIIGDPKLGVRIAKHLVENDIPKDKNFGQILGVIGHFTSDVTLSAGQVYDGKLVAVSPTSTAVRTSGTNLTNPSHVGNYKFDLSSWVFRIAPDDSTAAKKLVGSLQENKKVGIIYDSRSIYSMSLSQEFKKKLKELPTHNGDPFTCNLAEVKPENCVNQAKQQGIQVLMLTPSTEVLGKAILAAAKSEKNIELLGGDAVYSEDVQTQLDPEKVKRIVLVVPCHRDNNPDFKDASVKLWGTSYLDWKAMTSYDATQVLVEGLNKVLNNASNPTRQGLYQALSDNFSATGVTGTVRFNPSHDRLIDQTNEKTLGVLVNVKEKCNPDDPKEPKKLKFCLLKK